MMRKEVIGMQRFILHSDANSFYASVEMLLNPDLRDKAVAVCGSVENRHGIVLSKSERAKKAGVKTGQANWEARQACPGLISLPNTTSTASSQLYSGTSTFDTLMKLSPLEWMNAGSTSRSSAALLSKLKASPMKSVYR